MYFVALFLTVLLVGCGQMGDMIQDAGEPTAETVSRTEKSIEEYQLEPYDGPQARVAVYRFQDHAANRAGVVRGGYPAPYWDNPQIGILVVVPFGTLTTSTEEANSFAVPKEAAVATDWLTAWSQTPGEWKRLEDRKVGYTLLYPRDWSVEGQVAATEFAIGSRCQSVRVVDFEPPPGSGPGAQVRHSFLQVCAKPIEGGESLQDFMRQTYGVLLARTFQMAKFNGLSVYQTREEKPTKMIITEIKNHRIQIYLSVVADLEKYPTRKAQVENILASFSVI
jgi:hypothetical protein